MSITKHNAYYNQHYEKQMCAENDIIHLYIVGNVFRVVYEIFRLLRSF